MNSKEVKFISGIVLIVIALSGFGVFAPLLGIGGTLLGKTMIALVLLILGIWLIVISKRGR